MMITSATNASVVATSTPSSVSAAGVAATVSPGAVLLSPDVRDLPLVSTRPGVFQTMSATGGTIHHLGQSPPRSLPPLANPSPSFNMTSTSHGAHTPPRRPSGSSSPGSSSPRAVMVPSSPVSAFGLPAGNKSPLSSPERPRKRKLEEKPAATAEAATYRALILQHRQKQMAEIREAYNEHLTELFFLQHGGNLLDYMTWKRRPTPQLLACLQAGALDSYEEVGHLLLTHCGPMTPFGDII